MSPRIPSQHSRRRASTLCAGALLLGLPGCGGERPAPATNVLLVTFDTTRVDAVGCYGGPGGVSPTIDAFAAEGVRFTQAYTTAPLTLPAHASLLTGLAPDHHGVRANETYVLPAVELTLAEILAEEGWETAAFVASFVLDARYGLAQGFETYDDEIDVEGADVTRVAERPADAVTDRALAWLDARDTTRPFFLWLHYYDPHYPHELRPGQAARFESIYHDEVAFADAQLMRVRARLGELGLLDDTLTVITADHGEGQGEHGEDTHGYFLYQGTQHVPLILAHGHLAQRAVDARPASLVDVVPTVLNFLLLDVPPGDGLDLLAPLDVGRAPLYMEAELGRIDFGLTPLRGALQGSLKWLDTPTPELFDVVADPGETENLTGSRPEPAARLEAWLDARPVRERGDAVLDSDAEAGARLRALGYTGGAPNAEGTRDDWTPEQLARWSRTLTTGLRHYQLDELPRAIEILQPLVAECPGAFGARRFLGMALVRTGKVPAGLEQLEAAAALQPDASADLWWNVAAGRAVSGRPKGAREALERTLQLDPEHVRALQKLAELELNAREPEAARAHLEALLRCAPKSPEGRWARGVLQKL